MSNKIISLDKYMAEIAEKSENETIVFTNGCFDILHPGHTDYLAKAKKLGDKLIVGLNTDASVQMLKGASRPIQNLEARALVLSALSSVDYIISFNDETPIKLITAIKPDVLVKGGDYTQQQIVGASEVIAAGGRVEIIPFLEGYSTSNIVKKIRE